MDPVDPDHDGAGGGGEEPNQSELKKVHIRVPPKRRKGGKFGRTTKGRNRKSTRTAGEDSVAVGVATAVGVAVAVARDAGDTITILTTLKAAKVVIRAHEKTIEQQ